MKEEDLPALWRTSDKASAAAQGRFFALLRWHLRLLAATAVLAAWNPTDKGHDRIVSWAVASAMLIALALGFALRLGKPDEAWFRARALAENTKSAAWRFMIGPRRSTAGQSQTDELAFLDQLRQIRERFPAEKEIAKHGVQGEEITQFMRDVRKKKVEARKKFYVEHRLDDQLTWYRSRAAQNAKKENVWSGALLVVEVVAVLVAFARLLFASEFNPTGALAGVAAALLTWMQSKRFSDLASTYAVACNDLNDLKARAEHVRTDEELTAFVGDVETAISREHRIWIDRRLT